MFFKVLYIIILTFFKIFSFQEYEPPHTDVNICSNSLTKPIVQFVSNDKICDKPPCDLYVGKYGYFLMNFTSPTYLENIVPKIYAILADFQIPFPLPQKDACDGVQNTVCPIVKSENVSYVCGLDTPGLLPKIGLALEFILENKDTQEEVICFKVDIQVI